MKEATAKKFDYGPGRSEESCIYDDHFFEDCGACGAKTETGALCTRPLDHKGLHEASNAFDEAVARWE
jgi:hypothetical protein